MVNFKSDGKAIFTMFLGAIIAATLIVGIADQVFNQTTRLDVTLLNVTAPAVNVSLDVIGRDNVQVITIANGTDLGDEIQNLGAFLTTNISSTTGLLSVQLFLNDSVSDYAGTILTLNYTANPDGYVSDVGGRAITKLITLFSALAILIFIIVILFQQETLSKLIGKK